MAELIEGVNPTRMELLKLKERVKLARKGHKLLKEKRDALVMELFDVIEEARGIRGNVERLLREAFEHLIIAESVMGVLTTQEAAMSVEESVGVDFANKNIMGVLVPLIEARREKKTVIERGYELRETSAKLDEATDKFEDSIEPILKLAEIETSVKLLAEEIEKTKRRVNALEYIVIPRLENTTKYIEMRLDEMERENFFRLKRIKSILAAREVTEAPA